MSDLTRVLIVHPTDLARPKVGGIHSFLNAFIRLAPADLLIEHLGIGIGTAGADDGWHEDSIDGRAYCARRLMTLPSAEIRHRVPLGLRFAAALAKSRRELELDNRILQFHRPGLAIPMLGSGRPMIQVIHLSSSQLLARDSESRWRLMAGTLRRVEARVLPRMSAIFAIGGVVAQDYRARYPRLASRISHITNWVDERHFKPLVPAEREAARKELADEIGADPRDRIVLFVGRLEQQKRPLLAVEAMGVIGDPTVRMAFIGDGSLHRSLSERVISLGLSERVTLVGPRSRDALARVMGAADALLISSAHETGPTVAFEALACGLPIASSGVGHVPTLIRGTQAGVIAATDDSRALADALREALTAPQQRRRAAVDAVAPYKAATVLEPFYEAHRRVARRDRSVAWSYRR